MNNPAKIAFLVPFFGKLPLYFDYWALSCVSNAKNFHWFVYNDKIDQLKKINSGVTLIPYTFDEMKEDFAQKLDIHIPGRHLRRVCDYRMLFYFIRKKKENLDQFDFIGYTDMDMVYGQLDKYMPGNMDKYSIIAAEENQPSGPFTLMNRKDIHYLTSWKHIKETMEQVEHHSFNENPKLLKILSQKRPAWAKTTKLHSHLIKNFNSHHHFAVWDKEKIFVWDCWQRRIEGGFYHFSRFKDKPRFKIDPLKNHTKFGIHKFGITTSPDSMLQKTKMHLSLYI